MGGELMYQTILYEKKGGIGLITVNRPHIYNALSKEVLGELLDAVNDLEQDSEVRVFIITGSSEKAFVSGADINELQNLTPAGAVNQMYLGQQVFSRIEQSSKPSIAAVNGYALGGGCELAMACDIRIAARSAKLGQPEINLGNMPGWGGTQRLPRLVGTAKAKELILTGDMITGEEAVAIGLCNHAVDLEVLMDKAFEMAEKIARRGPLSVAYAKKAVHFSQEMSVEAGMVMEAFGVGLCVSTEDQTEGVNAFLEKRKPVFEGK